MTVCDQQLGALLLTMLTTKEVNRRDEAQLMILISSIEANHYSIETIMSINAVIEGLANGSIISVP